MAAAAKNKDLQRQFDVLEGNYDDPFKIVLTAIRELMSANDPPKKRRIGFVQD